MSAVWRTTTLGACCEIISGATPSTGDPRLWDGEIAWATPKDLSGLDSKFISVTERRITRAGLDSCTASVLPPYSVLFSSRAPIGHVAINTVPMATNQGFKSFIPNSDELDPHFLYHWLRARRLYLESLGNGTTFKEVSKTVVSRVEIVLPPLAEQRRIAAILDKADAIRRKRKVAIALTEELLRSAFLEIFGDPAANPKKWPTAAVEDLCSIIVDCPHTTPKYSGDERFHPCVRTSDLQRGFFDWSTTRHVSAEEYSERIVRLKPIAGDVFYTREGERYGIAAILPEGVPACLGQRMMLLRPEGTAATSEFLWALMNSSAVYQQATAKVGGSTSPHVNVKSIRRFQIIRPPLSIQREYSRICRTATRSRSRGLAALEKSEFLFASLIHTTFGDSEPT